MTSQHPNTLSHGGGGKETYPCSYCGERFERLSGVSVHGFECEANPLRQRLSEVSRPASNCAELAEQLRESNACLKELWERVPTDPLMELGKRIRKVLNED